MSSRRIHAPMISGPSSLDNDLMWRRSDYSYTIWSFESGYRSSVWRITLHGNEYLPSMSTSWLLDTLRLKEWPSFRTIEEARKWCERQEAILTGERPWWKFWR